MLNPTTLKMTLTAGFILLSTLPGHAAAPATCEAIDKAISANEDFVEVVLGTDAKANADAQKAVHDSFAVISPALAPDVVQQATAAIAKMDQAFAANQIPDAALAAMDNYTILVKAFENRLPTTLDVAMLDHAGFKLRALVAQKSIDWTAVSDTVAATDAHMKASTGLVTDKAVSSLLQTISTGLTDAQAAKQPAWQDSTAQLLLDSVDLIERNVKNPSPQACS